jgi:hypothetical protein
MTLNITRNLNLVIPLLRADGTNLYVHSMPISTETFERYFMVPAKKPRVLPA